MEKKVIKKTEKLLTEKVFKKSMSSIDESFSSVARSFSAVDERFSEIDKRFSSIDKRLEGHEKLFVSIVEQLTGIAEGQKHLQSTVDGFVRSEATNERKIEGLTIRVEKLEKVK